MKQLFKGQISCKAVFSKQARDSYYHGILAATALATSQWLVGKSKRMRLRTFMETIPGLDFSQQRNWGYPAHHWNLRGREETQQRKWRQSSGPHGRIAGFWENRCSEYQVWPLKQFISNLNGIKILILNKGCEIFSPCFQQLARMCLTCVQWDST